MTYTQAIASLAEIKAETEGHTSGEWEWARREYTREEYLAYCAESWDRADPNPHDKTMSVIQTDVGGENLTIAILGNGPTAHINGPLLAATPDLLDITTALVEEIERLRGQSTATEEGR